MKRVVIIGGGPAGASVAYHLALYYKVILIQDRIWEKPCGGGVKKWIFDEMKIPTHPIKKLVDKVRIWYKNSPTDIDLGGPDLAIVRRDEFDLALRKMAENRGAKIVYGRFKGIKNNKAIVKINGKDLFYPYDILVGADGVNSTVRKVTKLPPVPKVLTYYVKTLEYKPKGCEFFFDEEFGGDYYGWAFPYDDDFAHVGSASKQGFNNLSTHLGIFLKPKGYFIPVWEENITIQKDNVYLVGDAAAQVMPMTFEGIYYAIKSGEILAKSIKENRDYKKLWDEKYLKDFQFMKKIEKLYQSPFRNIMVASYKLNFLKSFSISLWKKSK